MKLSIAQANELFKKTGLDAQVVEDDKADKDADIEAAVTAYHEEQKGEYKAEFEKEVNEGAEKTFGSKLRGTLVSSLLREFGLSGKKEFEGLDSNEAILKKVKEMYDTKNGATKQEWEAERTRMQQEHDAEIADYETKLAAKDEEMVKANTTWQGKYDDHFINNEWATAMGRAPKKAGDILELADLARYKASKEYEMKFNHDSKKMEAYQNGKLVKDFNIDNYISTFLEKSGNKATDMRNLPPKDVPNNPNYRQADPPPAQQGRQAHSSLAAAFDALD